MLPSDFFCKVGWDRIFMEPSRGLLASLLEKIHWSAPPQSVVRVCGDTQTILVGAYIGIRSIWTHVLAAFKTYMLFDPVISLVEIHPYKIIR